MKAINYSSSICTRTRKSVFSGLCAPGTRVFDWRKRMINIIISAILVATVGTASFYIWKEKKKGNKCIGCPYSGSASCHCKQSALTDLRYVEIRKNGGKTSEVW